MTSSAPNTPGPQASPIYAERYKLLFENTCELASIDEVIYDEQGRPVDWILREVNEAYIRAVGIPRDKIIGHRVTEVYALERAHQEILNAYADVADTGKPKRFETYISYLHSDYMVCIFHISGPYFGRGMMDISACKQVQEELTAQRQRFQAVIEALPVGVFLADADARISHVNRFVKEIWHGSVPLTEKPKDYSKYRGWWHNTGELIKPEEWALVKVLRTGQPVAGEIVDIERLDGTRGTIINSAAPLFDPDGKLTGAVAVNQDITELVGLRLSLERTVENLRRESKRVAAIESIAEAGISTLALQDLLQTLVLRMARALNTHSCTIMVLDEQAAELVTRAAYNAPQNIGSRLRIGEGFAGTIAKERKTIYIADIQRSHLAAGAEGGQTRSVLGTPLIARDRVVGITYLDMLEIREFTPEEVRLLEAMAARAALAIDNAMLYEEVTRSRQEIERSLDKEKYFSLLLQRALLPRVPQVSDSYEVAVRYVPAYSTHEIGGDFYDVFPVRGDKIGVMVGDVSGKGLEAASVAAATRNTVRAFSYEFASPGKALTRANLVLHDQQTEIGSFVTVFLAIIDSNTGSVTYANGGHPPPIMLRANGTVEELSYGQPPIALMEEIEYESYESHIAPGDTLVVYTDGVSEARRDNEMFGQEGIERTLLENQSRRPDQLAEIILSTADKWAGGHIADDIAIVALKRLSAPAEGSL